VLQLNQTAHVVAQVFEALFIEHQFNFRRAISDICPYVRCGVVRVETE
jgi:hypothetical protein